MRILGDVTIKLPYTLDFCAKGPDVEPIEILRDGVAVTIYFPPSMSEGTVGQSFFSSGWAWWTGTTLRLNLALAFGGSQAELDEANEKLKSVANDVLRRFLTAYRLQFHRPDVYPLIVEQKDLALVLEMDNGETETLPEPDGAYFYRRLPAEAPLEHSINSTTLPEMIDSMTAADDSDAKIQLLLDAKWFDDRGETTKAAMLRNCIERLP